MKGKQHENETILVLFRDVDISLNAFSLNCQTKCDLIHHLLALNILWGANLCTMQYMFIGYEYYNALIFTYPRQHQKQ